MNIKAFGTFKTIDTKIFRTEACLHIGDSNQPIGLIAMLNPGSSQLANESEWSSFLKSSEAGEVSSVTNELRLDPTMESIINIFKNINPEIQGVIQIYNLFNYRCGNSNEAIRMYSALLKESKFSSFLHSPFPNLDSFPWIWTAWSVNDAAVLNKRKTEILSMISSKKKFAIYTKSNKRRKELYCYHPCPLRLETKEWVQNNIINEFKEYYAT
jgi:Protein of unknown function (DUF1643)